MLHLPLLLLFALCLPSCNRHSQKQGSRQTEAIPDATSAVFPIIETSLNNPNTLLNIPFSAIVKASSGKEIIPIDPNLPADAELLATIKNALVHTLERFNRSDSPTRSVKRINEVSGYFEKALQAEIESVDGFLCTPPFTAEGKKQRSGYPDLRIVHQETGRVTYLDPKLIAPGSLNSSLRTFYFTPKNKTGKILDDAHHLLVGIEHDGNTGNWHFTNWHLVDLTALRVRLKPEFQASNKDLYQKKLILFNNSTKISR